MVSRDFPGRDLDELDRLAAAPRAGRRCSRYPLVSPGRAVPVRRARRRAAFTLGTGGRRRPSASPPLLQGVAYVERLCFDHLDLLGAPIDGDSSLTGGATRSRYWCQLRADVLGRPVTLPANAEPALGMAVLAASPGATARRASPPRWSRSRRPSSRGPGATGRFDEPYLRLVDELERRGWLAAPTRARTHGERTSR